MRNYIQSQAFHEQIKDVAHHAFFKQIPKEQGLDIENIYLAKQVHSNHVVEFSTTSPSETAEGDAIVTNHTNVTLAVRTADCAPILLVDPDACVVGIAHAGWKGAKAGVVENTLAKMNDIGAKIENIIVVIGPCIHQQSYEINEEFFVDFTEDDRNNITFFIKSNNVKHYMFDLSGYVKHKLRNVKSIYDCNINTYINPKEFASYRRVTHQKTPLKTKNISTIRLLGCTDGINEWKSLLQDVRKSNSGKKTYQQQDKISYTIKHKSKQKNNIQSKLDLHGYNQEEVFNALSDFIKQQYEMNNRSLLIITGKGSGIIRESVHKWLQHSQLSEYLLSFTQATVKDGGEGALYLQLKKIKPSKF